MRFLSAVTATLLLVQNCSAQTQTEPCVIQLSDQHVVLLLDSASAAEAITTDHTDQYFERVNASEMSIQMKKPLPANYTRDEILEEYVSFLRNDVEEFSSEEKEFTEKVIRGIYDNCMKLSPTLFPDTILLIKTAGRHYGNSVYYTRENCIVIPANELAARPLEAFTGTMYHEVFHVYSRKNPEKRRELYQLIGFEGIGYDQLNVPEPLAERVMHNPDGVDFAQKITLNQGDSTVYAVPIIYANHLGFKEGQREFFGYVEFSLFEIRPGAEGVWSVVTQADGYSSTLNMRQVPDFFRQIRDNTGYIIHPDEVLADNFTFVLLGKLEPAGLARFSPAGKELLNQVEQVLVR